MKLVLQIAAGILLAVIVGSASIAAYRYVVAQAHAQEEADAAAQLRGLTLEALKASCGQTFGEDVVTGLVGWRQFNFLHGQVTVGPSMGPGSRDGLYEVHWVKKLDGQTVYTALEELQVLPCLTEAKRASELAQNSAK